MEKTYDKLLRCTLDVRTNTPTLTVYIESGFLPIKSLIIARQLKFFNRYKDGVVKNSPRETLFNRLMLQPSTFLKYYIELSHKYNSVADVYLEYREEVKRKIRTFAGNDQYKYKIYLEINPELKISPFINNLHPLSKDIIRFRLGSHFLPIETGRWHRTLREHRLCRTCGVLGDERHAIYHCTEFDRPILPGRLCEIWLNDGIFELFKNLKNAKLLDR